MNSPISSPPALPASRPAPESAEEVFDDEVPADVDEDQRLHELAEAWVVWSRTRRYYGPPPLPAGLLGRLTKKTGPKPQPGGPDAFCSAELLAFHLAVVSEPKDALDRRVFEAHYLWQVRKIKVAAEYLGVSRPHWYRLVRQFRARVYAASLNILRVNLEEAARLPHRV